jgi:exodeoxyribonuclease VII small subunit
VICGGEEAGPGNRDTGKPRDRGAARVSDTKQSFRTEIERLEEIVRSLESNDLDLDRALQLFEEGVGRLKTARKLLSESEITVKRVLEEADGTLSTDDVSL